ncbi:MAG: hypothetical protein J1E85_10115 [Ruminococcus sp.]|nr:hypothetical protein [Ruminococcus sp.]
MITPLYNIESEILDNITERKLSLVFDDFTIGSDNIVAESFELDNSILDQDEFKLGGCIASQMNISVYDVENDLTGKKFKLYIDMSYNTNVLYPSENLLPSENQYPLTTIKSCKYCLFTGFVYSAKRQNNRHIRDIIAFDDMYKLSQIYCKYNFYNYVYHRYSDSAVKQTITVGDLMKAIFDWSDVKAQSFGINNFFNLTKELNFDYKLIESTINEKITLIDLLSACCELNACFAIVDRDGLIVFKTLYDTSASLETHTRANISTYSNLSFEDYTMKPITMISFPYNNNKVFKYGSSEKYSYYNSDNIVTRCCTDIRAIVTAFSDNASHNYIFNNVYSYRPYSADIFGRWWIEAGDFVSIPTTYDDVKTVNSFVLSRTLKGINGMTCTIEAKGVEYLGKDELTDE